jgi:hypothetical protein
MAASKRNLGDLIAVLLQDLRQRQHILADETQHFIDSIAYRFPKNGQQHGSALSLLVRLTNAAHQLRAEIEQDDEERSRFETWWTSIDQRLEAPMSAQAPAYHCFFLVWQAKMMNKAVLIAERIGNLHDRLEQQLQRTNPDFPSPILHRRAEQGQVDKFLCEHVKWVHRDLARFVALKLSATYPYSAVPDTFQSWQYEGSATQHSFISYAHHSSLREKFQGADRPAKPLTQDPHRFTVIGLSYWMTERLISHPIIGHELAHQILQELYGRQSPYMRLEGDASQLGRCVRRLIRCAEVWLLHRQHPLHNSPEQAWQHVREILCDVLAAQRYGCAYLYAWIIEVSANPEFANLMHDAEGMLRPITDFNEVDEAYIAREILAPSAAFAASMRLDIFYRGTVLIAFLREGRELDDLSTALLNEVEVWLQRFLSLATGVLAPGTDVGDAQAGFNFEKEFARDLALTLVEEESRRSDPDIGNSRASELMRAAAKQWEVGAGGRLKDRSLVHQVMSNPVRKIYLEKLAALGVPYSKQKGEQLRTLQDALWRVEWATASSTRNAHGVEPQAPSGPRATSQALRALDSIGLDDYLYRTGNPLRLLQAISRQRPPEKGQLESVSPKSNSILDKDLETLYGPPPWVPALDALLRGFQPGQRIPILKGFPLTLTEREIQHLGPMVMNDAEWFEIGLGQDGCQLCEMHLLSLKPALPADVDHEVNERYRASLFAPLLGRYDAVAIRPAVGRTHRIERTALDGRWSSVSRLRYLVPVAGNSPAEEGQSEDILVTVLISLRWDASRLMFARWLKRHLHTKCDRLPGARLYLSDGSEDLVLVLARPPVLAATPYLDPIVLIRFINGSPLVANTETLFSSRALHTDMGLKFRFVCARSVDGLLDTELMMEKSLDGAHVPRRAYSVEAIAGMKDVLISVKDDEFTKRIYAALHQAAQQWHFRVETRVSWTNGPSEPHSSSVPLEGAAR